MNYNDWEKKLKSFERRIKRDSDNGILWYWYGDFLWNECDNPQKTVHAFEMAQKLLPDKDLRMRLGSAYVKSGQFEKGISLMLESLKESPTEYGYCFLASAYLKKNMYKEANEACQKALSLDPDFEEAFYLLGESYKKDNPKKAIECYKKALKRDSTYQLAWQALGRELLSENKIQEGISALCKAIELDPQDGWSKSFLAHAYRRIGEIEKAEEQYKDAIEVFPKYPDVYKWYAEFLESQDRIDKALELRNKMKSLSR